MTAIKLERGQFLGLRTALGYRRSTPTNVIIAESKVTFIRNRATFLAKNFCVKIMKHGPNNIKKSIEELCRTEAYYRYRRPMQEKSVLVKAWDDLKKFSVGLGKPKKGHDIWKMSYNTLTTDLEMDLEYGKQLVQLEKKTFSATQLESLNYGEQDETLIEGVMEKYNMKTIPLIVYTDGSSPEGSISTGASLLCDEEDTRYYVSMPKNCTVFTSEAFAIKTALELILKSFKDKRYKQEDIIIFSDCQGFLKAIKSNRLTVYHNSYILEIRALCRELNILFVKKKIFFIWIPSHRGSSLLVMKLRIC